MSQACCIGFALHFTSVSLLLLEWIWIHFKLCCGFSCPNSGKPLTLVFLFLLSAFSARLQAAMCRESPTPGCLQSHSDPAVVISAFPSPLAPSRCCPRCGCSSSAHIPLAVATLLLPAVGMLWVIWGRLGCLRENLASPSVFRLINSQ